MIGHLQRNKVKFIAPFVRLIHGVDSEKLLKEIDKRAKQNNRTIDCLLQVHIATESTKFGFSEEEVLRIMKQKEDFKNTIKKLIINIHDPKIIIPILLDCLL